MGTATAVVRAEQTSVRIPRQQDSAFTDSNFAGRESFYYNSGKWASDSFAPQLHLLLPDFPYAHDSRSGAKFLVIAKGLFFFDVEILE